MKSVSPSLSCRVAGRLAVSRWLPAALVALAAAWIILFLAIPPSRQNFPLIDDWSFTRLAFRYARGDGFQYDGWPSMPVIGQCIWAAPFIWVFGESFFLMRITTLILMGLAMVALFDLSRSEPGVSARSAAFGTAAMAFNPFFFAMSGTFMTDVPTLSFSLIALALARRGAASVRAVPIVAGGLAALLATTTRQNAGRARRWRSLSPAKDWFAKRLTRIVAAGVPLAVGLATVVWFIYQPKVNVRSIYWPSSDHLTDVLLRHGQVLGLSAVPVLLLRPRRMLARDFLFWLGFFGCWTWGWIYFNNLWYHQPYWEHIQPLPGDVIRATGVYFHKSWTPWIGIVTRISLTVIGCFGLAGLIAGPGRQAQIGKIGWTLLAFTAVHLLLMSMTQPVYERYMIVLLPGVMLRTIPRRLPLPNMRPNWWLGLTALGLTRGG